MQQNEKILVSSFTTNELSLEPKYCSEKVPQMYIFFLCTPNVFVIHFQIKINNSMNLKIYDHSATTKQGLAITMTLIVSVISFKVI